jgi:phospholipase D
MRTKKNRENKNGVAMLRKGFILLLFFSLLIVQSICLADNFLHNSTYDICFTPGDNCANKIIRAITQTKKEILVQAYSFSDASIAKALVLARARGVDVRIILDKSQLKARYGLIPYFISNNINPIIDNEVAIAHNKIIILDRHTVITGSYNYTGAAKNKNAENVVIIDDLKVAEKYVKYWYARQNRSKEIYNLKIKELKTK